MKSPSAIDEAGSAAMRAYFLDLAHYHAWASEALWQQVEGLSDADYRRDAGLFFKSVHGTCNHLLVGEGRVWWPRFAEGVSNRIALNAEVEPERAAVGTRLLEGARRWQSLIETLDGARFAEAERDAIDGDPDIAHRGQAEAAGVAVAVDAGDHRHRAREHRPQHRRQRLGVGAVLRPGVGADLAHEGEVGASAEGLAAAAEDDRAHAAGLGLRSECSEGGAELADQRAVEGVAHVGAVEPDAGDAARALDAKRVRHVACLLLSICSIRTQSISGQG